MAAGNGQVGEGDQLAGPAKTDVVFIGQVKASTLVRTLKNKKRQHTNLKQWSRFIAILGGRGVPVNGAIIARQGKSYPTVAAKYLSAQK